jgi:hypothetical protein
VVKELAPRVLDHQRCPAYINVHIFLASRIMQCSAVLQVAHLGCGDEVVHLVATDRAHGLCAGLARRLQPPITKS